MNSTRLYPLLLSAFFLTACNLSFAADVTPPPGIATQPVEEVQKEATNGPLFPLVSPDPIKGEETYLEKCAPCHGTKGLGDGPRADDLPNPVTAIGTADIARQSTPADWFRIVTEGNLERFMPPFPSLNDRQRWDVVAYTYSLSSSPESIAQGEKIFQANCTECHGESGRGDGPLSDDLALVPADFTDKELMVGVSQATFFLAITEGVRPDMRAYEDQFSESERWSLTDFIRSLNFTSNATFTSRQATTVSVESTPITEASPKPGDTPPSDIEPGSEITETQKTGKVTGSVVNTSDGEFPPGLQVTLHGFDHIQAVITATTTTEDDGTFIFEDVEMPVGHIFITTVDYKGTTYGSEIVTVQNEISEIELPIEIYETTSDPSVLVVDRLHYFFEFLDEQTIQVVELYIVSNPTKQTVVASESGSPILTFELPPDAENLEFQDGILGERYVVTPKGFGDTAPIRPGTGTHQTMFTYQIPYNRKLELTRPVDLTTNAVVILVPEDEIKIKGDRIIDAGTRDVQGIPYRMYNGASLSPGEELRLTISGHPSWGNSLLARIRYVLSFVLGALGIVLIAALGALSVVLIAAGVWFYLRNKPQRAKNEPHESSAESYGTDTKNPETIMDAILALDDLYREGQLPEEAYLERRSDLKRRLQQLLDQE